MNNVIKSKLRKIKYRVISLKMYSDFKRYHRDNCIFLLETPLHGNIGDHAIAYAEWEFFKNNFPDKTVIEIPSKYVPGNLDLWEKIIGMNQLFIHGGGFIGTLWKNEDENMRAVINCFKDNRIIILPQSIYYENEEESEIYSFRRLLGVCSDVVLCEREKYSYEFATTNFPECKHLFIPDMVLYSKELRATEKKKSNMILFCLRSDHEKTASLTVEEINEFLNINHLEDNELRFTDTVVHHNISKKERYDYVVNKINEFSNAQLVITDRLHGMVLSAIAGTPAIVFDNVSHKVIGEYEWLKDVSNIRMVRTLAEVSDAQDIIKNRVEYDNSVFTEYFEKLKGII